MAVAVLHSPGDLRIERRPVEHPASGEVLLAVTAVGICGSDLHYYHEGRSGSSVVSRPTVLGHEFGGRVVAVGEGVDPARLGERVSVEPGVQCGSCEHCRAGAYNLCREMRFYGAAPEDGAMQEYLAVVADHAHAVPDGLSDAAAALLEPLSVAVRATSRAAIGHTSKVLITGAGPIGLLVAQVARAGGASDVTIVDPSDQRRAMAAAWVDRALTPAEHAERTADPDTPAVDSLLECSGSSQALAASAPTVVGGGRLVLVGVGPTTLSLPMDLVQERELIITGCHRYRDTWPEAIALAASGGVDLDALVTHRYPLDGLGSALARPSPGTVKAIIEIVSTRG